MATNHDERPSKLQLVTRLGFGALVGFGMVGSIAGYRQGAALVFLVTAACWSLTRILAEAVDAWRQLFPSDSPPPPPAPPTAAA